MVWYSHLFQDFPQLIVIHTVKGFGTVNKAEYSYEEAEGTVNKGEIDVDLTEIYRNRFFLELSCFFDNPVDVGHMSSYSSAFPKTSLNIWKFTVHILLKPGLENFEHPFTSV